MTLSRFIDYLFRRGDGEPDSVTFRAYDLLYGMGSNRIIAALRHVGIYVSEVKLGLMELAAQLGSREIQLDNYPPEELAAVLCEWYVWQRLEDGELRTWKRRAK